MNYADRACTHVEKNDPHRYVFTGKCIVTKKLYSVEIPGKELYVFRQGKLCIQDAMPSLSDGDREFLISGISPEGWDLTFKTGENDE